MTSYIVGLARPTIHGFGQQQPTPEVTTHVMGINRICDNLIEEIAPEKVKSHDSSNIKI